MEQQSEFRCEEACKFQRKGNCVLERLDQLAPVHGATCCDYLFEDEYKTHC